MASFTSLPSLRIQASPCAAWKTRLLPTRCISTEPASFPAPTHISIPKLSCSTPWKTHPRYSDLHPQYDQWTVDIMAPKTEEDRKHLLGQKLTLLICMLYPGALESRIHSVIKFIIWTVLVDDSFDDVEDLGANFVKAKSLVMEYLKVVSRGEDFDENSCESPALSPTHVHLLKLFSSAWKDFKRDMSADQFSTLKQHVESILCLQAEDTKTRQKRKTKIVTPEEFTARKRVSGVHLLGLNLVEYTLGVELEPEVRRDPELLELYRLTADCMLFCNELISFRMEFLAKDFHNMLWIIAQAEDVSLNKAALRLKFMWDRNTMEINRLQFILAERYSGIHGMEMLLQGTREILSGYVEWCWKTGRYHGYAWTPPPQREGVMLLEEVESSGHCAQFLALNIGELYSL